MDHIAHLTINTFMQSYDEIITLIKRENKILSPSLELNVSYLNKRESPSPKDGMHQVWLK